MRSLIKNIFIAVSFFYCNIIFCQNCTVYTPSNIGFPDANFSTRVVVDNKNNKWIGYSNKGLLKFNDTIWTVDTTIPFSLFNIFDISIDTGDNIWMAAGDLIKYDGSSWIMFSPFNDTVINARLIRIDPATNNKWVTANGPAWDENWILKFDGNSWDYIYSDLGNNQPVYFIGVQNPNFFWYSTQ